MKTVKVFSASSRIEAELIKSLLEHEGIPAMISAETYGQLLAGTFGPPMIGEVRVLVRQDHAERAKRIISEVSVDAEFPGKDMYGEG